MARLPALQLIAEDGTESSATRASAAYDRIRQDIVHGVLPPGSRLRVESMSSRYEVGATPLREALNRLSAEGLVQRNDQRGFNVSALDWEELPLLRQTRCDIESLALRQAIEHRTAAWEDSLVLLIHRLGRTSRSLSTETYIPNPAWEELHNDFHRALLAACPSRWLRSYSDALSQEAYRFRQVAAGRVFTKRNEHDEHKAIFEAAIEGRAGDAVRNLVEHYTRTSDIVMEGAKDLGHLDNAQGDPKAL